MFKWKVTGLGGSSKKIKGASSNDGNATKLNNESAQNNTDSAKATKNLSQSNIQTQKKESKSKEKEGGGDPNSANTSATSPNPNPKGFRLFSSGSNVVNAPSTSQSSGPTNGILKNYDKDTMSRVGQRLAMTNIPPPAYSPNNNNNTINNNNNNNVIDRLRLNLSTEQIYSETEVHNTSLPNGNLKTMLPPPPPIPPSKPRWHQGNNEEEEAIPNDSLYANQDSKKNGSLSWKEKQFGSRPSLNGMAHWSSHGYLAKASDTTSPASFENPDHPNSGSGYVLLRKQGEQLMASRQQPQSLPNTSSNQDGDRKYFSVKGFNDMSAKHPQEGETSTKYLSVDARYNSMKNLPPDLRTKLRENLRQVHEQQQHQQQMRNFTPYQTPPAPPNYPMPPAPPPRPSSMKPAPPTRQEPTQAPKQPASNLESSKQMSNSVSWLEWTQQLQAYIAWVNSQLRKRSDLRAVQDLRTDLQSGEVLAQLIEIISGEKIAGIEYNPESIQGMRDNLDRILQFMAAKRIRMHHITSKEILEGNLKAVMRLILALAAHYKPQSVRHHDVSFDNQEKTQSEKSQQATVNEDKSKEVYSQATVPVKDKPSTTNAPVARNQESLSRSVSSSTTQTMVKRSPSMNENHYSPVSSFRPKVPVSVEDPDKVYENVSTTGKKTSSSTMTQSTEKTAISTQTESVKPVLQKEGSFVRTGSGRKLPKIPDRGKSQTLPSGSSLRLDEEDLLMNSGDKSDHRKSRPKALEFWETLETVDSNDFRYNTIHRMSMGRRMLPKPPPNNSGDAHQSHARSLSLDRSVSGNYHDDKESLNSSFSESDKLRSNSKDQGSVPPSPRPGVHKKIPPDGCSLQSSSSGGAPAGQPSPPSSSDTRGEVEGSSDNNSPPTSVIQGADPTSDSWDTSNGKHWSANPAFDWIRGAYGAKSTNPNFRSLEEEVNFLRNQRMGDGTISDKLNSSDTNADVVPCEILIHDLTQAKRQLLELHSLLLTNMVTNGDDNTNKTLSSDEFSECVENINVLNLRLRNADERCNRLRSDLKNSKQVGDGQSLYPTPPPPPLLLTSLFWEPLTQHEHWKMQEAYESSPECSNLQGSKLGLESRLAEQESNVSQLKQDLLRTTLAKQSLEFEKKEMMKRIEDLERGLAGVKSENGEKDKLIRAHKIQLEEFSRRSKDNSHESCEVELKSMYDEELTVAKDAISNLRTCFRDADPSQHILDTLEQCISVIIEKIQKLDFEKINSSRLNSLEYSRSNDGQLSSPHYQTTKILYFTNRSVTPFMSTINKKIGEINLRDFKTLFDRPGFYRFHFKTVDQEFGMVKEEISNDDSILPGADGKIVAWVEED